MRAPIVCAATIDAVNLVPSPFSNSISPVEAEIEAVITKLPVSIAPEIAVEIASLAADADPDREAILAESELLTVFIVPANEAEVD